MKNLSDIFLSNFGKILTHRWTIIAINLIIVFIGILVVRHFPDHPDRSPARIHEMCEVLTGIGVVLIGWGVVLEERLTLLHVFEIGDHLDAENDRINHICHTYGVGQLIIGLISEIIVEFVKLPDDIVNTAGVEWPVLYLGGALLMIGFALLMKFSFALAACTSGKKKPRTLAGL